MNILIINGSYHKRGMSAELIESFKSGLLTSAPQSQIKVIDLLETDVKFCTGTSVCGKNDSKAIGECVIKDAMADILKEMIACDILVMVSPIYWLTQTALMQRFLERCLPLLKYSSFGPRPRNPARKGKKGVVIISTGAPYPINILMGFASHAVKMLSMTCRICGCSKIASIKAGGMERDSKAKEKFLKQAQELGVRIAKN